MRCLTLAASINLAVAVPSSADSISVHAVSELLLFEKG